MKESRSFLLAGIAILMWSTAGTAFKLALASLSFSQLLLISSHTAWIVLLLYALISKKKISFHSKKALAKSALGGFLNPFLYYLVLLKAYSLLPAQLAQPLNYTWPIMLVILSVPFLKQKLRWFDPIALLISFLGVFSISFQGQSSFHPDQNTLLGIILASGSSLIWASFWIYNVKDQRDELEKLVLNFFFGALFITLLTIGSGQWPKLSSGWLPAIYVGFTEMAIAFVCWMMAMQMSRNNARISNLVFISPFLALFFIHLVLGEKIYTSTFIGLSLIIGGIFFQQLMAGHAKKRTRS